MHPDPSPPRRRHPVPRGKSGYMRIPHKEGPCYWPWCVGRAVVVASVCMPVWVYAEVSILPLGHYGQVTRPCTVPIFGRPSGVYTNLELLPWVEFLLWEASFSGLGIVHWKQLCRQAHIEGSLCLWGDAGTCFDLTWLLLPGAEGSV